MPMAVHRALALFFRLLLLLCTIRHGSAFLFPPHLRPAAKFGISRPVGTYPRTTMNDELREIRRRQRERWLAAQAQAQGQNGEDAGNCSGREAAASTNDVEPVSTDASGGAASAKSNEHTQGNAAGAGTSKKRARPVAASASTNTNASTRNVVDLTFDDTDTDGDEDVSEKKKAKSDAGGDSSSDVEILSPPRKAKQKQKHNGQGAKAHTQTTSNNTGPMPNFAVASYNIWFGQTARGDPHPERRMEAISSIISDLQPRPLLVGLQEVTSELEQLLYPLLQSMGYHVISQPHQSQGQYYVAIAVLTGNVLGGGISANANDANDGTVSAQVVGSGFQPYADTIMDRGLLWTHVRLCSGTSSREVLFTTTHLESYLTGGFMGRPYDGVAQRKLQICQAAQFCREYARTRARHGTRIDAAIITGDLNWDDERKRSKGNDEKMLEVIETDEAWTDAWLKCRPGEDGYTYDAKLNDMLRGNLRRRFDRCLVWNGERDDTDSGGIVPVQCDMIGTSAIAGLTYRKEKQKFSYGSFVPTGEFIDQPVSPSDHFGLYVTLGC